MPKYDFSDWELDGPTCDHGGYKVRCEYHFSSQQWLCPKCDAEELNNDNNNNNDSEGEE